MSHEFCGASVRKNVQLKCVSVYEEKERENVRTHAHTICNQTHTRADTHIHTHHMGSNICIR